MDDVGAAARSVFRDLFDAEPRAVAVAPGRVNLVGGHVDYNDGRVLPVPIDRATSVAAAPRSDGQLVVHSETTDETVRASRGSMPDGWAAYVFGTAAALADARVAGDALTDARTEGDALADPRTAGDALADPRAEDDSDRARAEDADAELRGATLAIATDLPLGAGLSSSAALCVATAGALDAVSDGGVGPVGDSEASVDGEAAPSDEDAPRERLAEIAWRAETTYVGTDCGIMDQLTSACGRAGHALRIDCRDRTTRAVPVPDDAALLVVDTTVTHELREDGYNDRVAECREAVARLDAALDREVASLRDVTSDEVAAHADRLGEPYTARARHVTSELERVDRAVTALESSDLATLGATMTDAHRSLASDYAVSCAEADAIVAGLRETRGVYGARLVGGGWGGSVVAVTDPDATARAGRAARERCERETSVTPEVYETRVGRGLRVVR